jgi:hypothetical protein
VGRARIALIAARSDIPGWFDPASPEPARTDFTTQEQHQVPWVGHDFGYAFFARAELEFRAGGNPSWNVGVDYTRQLARSADRNEVKALYQQAGLDLTQDLKAPQTAPRITADPQAGWFVETPNSCLNTLEYYLEDVSFSHMLTNFLQNLLPHFTM